ncbi:hypothetical protein [Mucilaginibacter sp. OK098]|uniref:hypothetical protein n=1 Tax=Mucilaginibacter sp. OK098 TaxID=1855297 RepID=UPI00091C8F6A|nr:hypothetical protein [Mucilaginibacter sp. OK098]SHM89816.1 hypothetical protein SAMN05216524_10418 [Mucilaginibacter sp. OK098]
MKLSIIVICLFVCHHSFSQTKKKATKSHSNTFEMFDLVNLIQINDDGEVDKYMLKRGFEFSENSSLDSITLAATYINKVDHSRTLKIVTRGNYRLYIEYGTKSFEDYINCYNYLKTHNYTFRDKTTSNNIIWLAYTNFAFKVTLGKGKISDSTRYDISIENRHSQ